MSALIHVAIHSSQFPEQIQDDLRHSLRRRQLNHKFHYDSYKQTQKWLELHQACSPSRTDPNCAASYDAAFAAAANRLTPAATHLIGLGCGGGQKDARLLRLLGPKSGRLLYTPVDASAAMVLVAHQAAIETGAESQPLVCDLSSAEDLAAVFHQQTPQGAARVFSFFGMMPNFEPAVILPKLAALLAAEDLLLLSANLASGGDYAAGLQLILPLYDNPLTAEWLMIFLLDLGVERSDGSLQWSVEPCPSGNDLLRLTARFYFEHARTLRVGGEKFDFGPGQNIQLFFSYRYTSERVRDQLSRHGLAVEEQWITESGEEGVFLCRRANQ